MTALFVLILFYEATAVRVGEYRTYDACEKAGFSATKAKQMDFLCIQADRR